jgi:hypothetical protein
LLDYEFILSKYNVKNMRFVGLEEFAAEKYRPVCAVYSDLVV